MLPLLGDHLAGSANRYDNVPGQWDHVQDLRRAPVSHPGVRGLLRPLPYRSNGVHNKATPLERHGRGREQTSWAHKGHPSRLLRVHGQLGLCLPR